MMNLNFRSVRATSVRPLVAARAPVAFSGMHAGKLTVGIPQGTPGLVVAAAWPATPTTLQHGKLPLSQGDVYVMAFRHL